MNVAVVGGTGFLGRHIAGALLQADHDVIVVGRHPERVPGIPLLAGATAARGDVTDAGTLPNALDGANAVVMVVTFPNYPMELPRKGLTFDRYEVNGAANLIAAAAEAGVDRFVYISGAGADSTSDKTWYRAKGRAEELVKASGLDYAIVRPSWVYGPEDRSVNQYVTMIRRSPVVPKLGVAPQRIQPLYVEDLAEAVKRIFERSDAWNQTFEIGGPEVVTMDEVITTVARVLGKKRTILPVPRVLAKIGTAPLVALPKPPMTPTGVDFVAQDGLVDLRATRRVLGIEPIGLEAGLRKYLEP